MPLDPETKKFIEEQAKKNKYDTDKDPVLKEFRRKMKALSYESNEEENNTDAEIDLAVRKCLSNEYWAFKLIHIYYSDEQTYTKYKYGIFTKPKLHFSEKLWKVKLQNWNRITLNGSYYYKNQRVKDDKYIWIIKDDEHEIVFYRF